MRSTWRLQQDVVVKHGRDPVDQRCEIVDALAGQRLRKPVHVRHDVDSELCVGLRFFKRVPRLADEIVHDLAFEFDPLSQPISADPSGSRGCRIEISRKRSCRLLKHSRASPRSKLESSGLSRSGLSSISQCKGQRTKSRKIPSMGYVRAIDLISASASSWRRRSVGDMPTYHSICGRRSPFSRTGHSSGRSVQRAKIGGVVGETSNAGKEAESGIVRRIQRGKIVSVAFRHDRVDAAISQTGQVRIRAERILPEVGENESTDDWPRRQLAPPQFPRICRLLWHPG